MKTEEKVLWVAYTNTDLTEGRGADVPIAMCEVQATAIRLAKKAYVQGSDGPVKPVKLLQHNGLLYAPMNAIRIVPPSAEDVKNQTVTDAKELAIEKAKAAGLSDEDIKTLCSKG